jgi:hypothetical protein
MTAYILNLLDMAFALHALKHGGRELNPIVNWMIGVHPLLFVFCKVVAAGVLLWWLNRESQTEPLARWGLKFLAGLYWLLILWHLINLFAIVAI